MEGLRVENIDVGSIYNDAIKLKNTFIHEYRHFLDNISMYWHRYHPVDYKYERENIHKKHPDYVYYDGDDGDDEYEQDNDEIEYYNRNTESNAWLLQSGDKAIKIYTQNNNLTKDDFFKILYTNSHYNALTPVNKHKAIKRFTYLWDNKDEMVSDNDSTK